MLESVENRDRVGKVATKTINVKVKNTRRTSPVYAVNFYGATSNLLINGPKIDSFKQEIIPAIQSTAHENNNIDADDKQLEKTLKTVHRKTDRI